MSDEALMIIRTTLTHDETAKVYSYTETRYSDQRGSGEYDGFEDEFALLFKFASQEEVENAQEKAAMDFFQKSSYAGGDFNQDKQHKEELFDYFQMSKNFGFSLRVEKFSKENLPEKKPVEPSQALLDFISEREKENQKIKEEANITLIQQLLDTFEWPTYQKETFYDAAGNAINYGHKSDEEKKDVTASASILNGLNH